MLKLILGTIDIAPLLKARNFFSKILEEAENDYEKTGAIKVFEFCYELSWKTLKKILEVQGKEVNNPRDTFRLTAQWGYISDPEVWFEFGKERNLTSHTYNEDILYTIFSHLSIFLYHLDLLAKVTTFRVILHNLSLIIAGSSITSYWYTLTWPTTTK